MKKNVLLITDQFRVGGGEKYFFKIENFIDRDRINLYSIAEDGECKNEILNKNNMYILPRNLIRKILFVRKLLKEKKIDLIHANSLTMSFIGNIAKVGINKNIKILYTKHNITILEKISVNLFNLYVNKFIDTLLTVCDFDRERLIKRGILKQRILSIPNGADLEQFEFLPHYLNYENGALNIGILARLSEEKNHKLFLEVIEKLNKNNTIANGFIAGDGPLKQEIYNSILKKNLNIKMLGNIKNPAEFLKNMDIILLTSTREVFPMSILEAMACGAIVLSVDVGGVKDSIINKKTGYLIKSHDASKFEEVIRSILDNKIVNYELIKEARKLVEIKYSNNEMINRISKLYMEE